MKKLKSTILACAGLFVTASLTSGAAAGKKKPKKPRATTTSAAPAQGDLLPSPQKDLFE